MERKGSNMIQRFGILLFTVVATTMANMQVNHKPKRRKSAHKIATETPEEINQVEK